MSTKKPAQTKTVILPGVEKEFQDEKSRETNPVHRRARNKSRVLRELSKKNHKEATELASEINTAAKRAEGK